MEQTTMRIYKDDAERLQKVREELQAKHRTRIASAADALRLLLDGLEQGGGK